MGLPCLSAVQEEKDGSRQKRAAQQWRRKIKGKRAGGDTKRRERQKMAESPTSFRKSLPPPSLSLTFFAASESKKLFWVGGKRGDESERGKRNWTFDGGLKKRDIRALSDLSLTLAKGTTRKEYFSLPRPPLQFPPLSKERKATARKEGEGGREDESREKSLQNSV